MQILSGQQIADSIYQKVSLQLTAKAKKLKLVILLATNEAAALNYTRLKQRAAATLGINLQIIQFAEGVKGSELISEIQKLNSDPEVGGIMVQLPLYEYLKPHRWLILNAISPRKDVDGLTAFTLGKLAYDPTAKLKPATVAAVLEILNSKISLDKLSGKNIVVANHSNLIGKPLSQFLLHYDATVSVTNIFTPDETRFRLLKNADIVITATGTPKLWHPDLFKEGAGLIDVTSLQTPDGIMGDYDQIAERELLASGKSVPLSWRTAVPGGVGPVTIACLLKNFCELNSGN